MVNLANAAVSVPKFAIRITLANAVFQFFATTQKLFVIVYCLFKVAELRILITKDEILSAYVLFVPYFFGNIEV